MLLALMLALYPAHALQPPVGWTAMGPDRAVMMPADPSRGEVRELAVAGDSIDPQGLLDALAQAGETASMTRQEADGTVGLKIGSGMVGRARAHSGTGQVTWYLVVASARSADSLDADALLTALIPRALPTPLQGAVEVLPAGRDGSLWDPVQTAEPVASQGTDLWGAPVAAAPSSWGHSQALVGVWGGTVGGPWGGGQEFVFTFDATGRLRIVEKSADGSQVTEGTWTTSSGTLRIASYTADPFDLPYTVDNKSMALTWQGQPLTLFPRR